MDLLVCLMLLWVQLTEWGCHCHRGHKNLHVGKMLLNGINVSAARRLTVSHSVFLPAVLPASNSLNCSQFFAQLLHVCLTLVCSLFVKYTSLLQTHTSRLDPWFGLLSWWPMLWDHGCGLVTADNKTHPGRVELAPSYRPWLLVFFVDTTPVCSRSSPRRKLLARCSVDRVILSVMIVSVWQWSSGLTNKAGKKHFFGHRGDRWGVLPPLIYDWLSDKEWRW